MSKSLDLLVLGDSFAQPFIDRTQRHYENWYLYLISKLTNTPVKNLNNTRIINCDNFVSENAALNGTSLWYSYRRLCEYVSKYEIKNVIFFYTSLSRAPIKDGEYATKSFQKPTGLLKNKEEKFIDYWYKIVSISPNFHDEFLPFMAYSIFNSVEMICKSKNINLVHVLTFYGKSQSANNINVSSEFPILTGIQDVSSMESGNIDDWSDIIQRGSFISGTDDISYDSRRNHLNDHNNKLLADTLFDLLEQPKPTRIDFSTLDIDISKESWMRYHTNLEGHK